MIDLPPMSLTRVTMKVTQPRRSLPDRVARALDSMVSRYGWLLGHWLWQWTPSLSAPGHYRWDGRTWLGRAYLEWRWDTTSPGTIRGQFGYDAYGYIGWIYWGCTWVVHWICLAIVTYRLGNNE
ncbi:hypothetical protein EB093_00835 [bacterium]|nr:hypothetical protein [bacterium]